MTISANVLVEENVLEKIRDCKNIWLKETNLDIMKQVPSLTKVLDGCNENMTLSTNFQSNRNCDVKLCKVML